MDGQNEGMYNIPWGRPSYWLIIHTYNIHKKTKIIPSSRGPHQKSVTIQLLLPFFVLLGGNEILISLTLAPCKEERDQRESIWSERWGEFSCFCFVAL